MPLTVDTLNIYNRLKSTGLSEESAKAIAEIFREAIEENLANKNDLKTTESNLTKYIESVRGGLKVTIESVRGGLEVTIESVRAELEIKIQSVRTELKKDIEVLRTELKKDIEVLRTELKKDIEVLRGEVKTEIAESKTSTIKWVAGMLVAQAALIATLVKLL